ncbi:hypothetical protein EV178_003168 [Coemansia sp. RSA 1646]|nr:hypothetical protein EV178_003168 [Coemansia sp. RSA 1646]KAJ2214472.1 hypothetical protein EV179_003015 [Coemansia sp. RSA 487]
MSGKSADGSDLPKIQLESKEDVQFLQHQFSDFLRKTISNNTTLRDASLSDEQQKEAEALVLSKLEEWTKNIWAMAGTSMAVNGFSYDEAMQEKSRIEPLDEQLRTEVQSLREEADELLLSVTQKRRTVPEQIEKLVKDGVSKESLVAEKTTVIKGLRADTVGAELPYMDDAINTDFERAVGLAKHIENDAPASIDKMKRLLATLEDAKSRTDAESDVREVLIGDELGATDSMSNGRFWRNGSSADDDSNSQQQQKQLLAYKAALHAITQDNTSGN